jgi:hypothetical protein
VDRFLAIRDVDHRDRHAHLFKSPPKEEHVVIVIFS